MMKSKQQIKYNHHTRHHHSRFVPTIDSSAAGPGAPRRPRGRRSPARDRWPWLCRRRIYVGVPICILVRDAMHADRETLEHLYWRHPTGGIGNRQQIRSVWREKKRTSSAANKRAVTAGSVSRRVLCVCACACVRVAVLRGGVVNGSAAGRGAGRKSTGGRGERQCRRIGRGG